MKIEDFYQARDMGWTRAEFHGDPMVGEDYDEFDDRIFPLAFADALEAFPQHEAEEISEAVHEGIRAYWDNVLESRQ